MKIQNNISLKQPKRFFLKPALFVILFAWADIVFSQTTVRDTSFTTYSAYIKAKKTQPFISIANPAIPAGVKVAKNIVYTKYGSRKLRADVFYPSASGNKPAVLLIFGGGWRSGDKSMNNAMAIRLAEAGFVAVSAEYRLSTEALYPAAVLDLKSALSWMRKKSNKYGIDTGKIAAMGCSAGGQLASLLGATNNSTLFQPANNTKHSSNVHAVIDIDGTLAFIHPESGEGDDSKGKSAATHWFGASKTEKPELWKQAGPLSHMQNTTVPFLFLNSSVARMHAGRDDAINILNKKGVYTEVHTFEDAPHPFWLFNPWFEPTMKYSINFLKKTLR